MVAARIVLLASIAVYFGVLALGAARVGGTEVLFLIGLVTIAVMVGSAIACVALQLGLLLSKRSG